MDRVPKHWTCPERVVIEAVRVGVFQIDTQGRVWRRTKRGLRRAENRTGRVYLQVRWMTMGRRYHSAAHRLVWQYLHGDIPEGHTINHRNGLKDDNRPSNLECLSLSENMKHANRSGLRDQHGQKNPGATLTDNQVAQIRLAYSHGGYTMVQLGAKFGVTFQTISKVIRGQRRPKQGGPVLDGDQRHCSSDRDLITGQFVGKKRAGAALDGREWRELPEGRS